MCKAEDNSRDKDQQIADTGWPCLLDGQVLHEDTKPASLSPGLGYVTNTQ